MKIAEPIIRETSRLRIIDSADAYKHPALNQSTSSVEEFKKRINSFAKKLYEGENIPLYIFLT